MSDPVPIKVLFSIRAGHCQQQVGRKSSDKDPEFISATLASWAELHHVWLDYIRPGRPDQNAYIERFNRTYREDVLDFYLFRSLQEIRTITEQSIHTYNHDRPHDALAGLTQAARYLVHSF